MLRKLRGGTEGTEFSSQLLNPLLTILYVYKHSYMGTILNILHLTNLCVLYIITCTHIPDNLIGMPRESRQTGTSSHKKVGLYKKGTTKTKAT